MLALVVTGCPGIVAGSKLYAPAEAEESRMFGAATRLVFPEDVRIAPERHKSTLVAWTGILRRATEKSATITRFEIEHHYWDWVEDYGTQKTVAFVSPRGEGSFVCEKTTPQGARPALPPLESFAIVYGYPISIDRKSQQVILDCKLISFAERDWYATDIWDYGKAYLLKRDQSDFRILRVPSF